MKNPILSLLSITLLLFLVNISFAQNSNTTKACVDNDGDGYEDSSCGGTDCDDSDPNIHPGAEEIPGNGIDENCDGSDACTCYVDADNDDYGDSNSPIMSLDCDCDDSGEAWVGYDCDDADPNVHPGATEVVDDGIDNDCSGDCLCWADADDDGYRPDAVSTVISSDLDCHDSGEATTADITGDCDDFDPSVHPGATEIINDGIDQDCNGFDAIYCYQDNDFDTYGNNIDPQIIANDGDCDDMGESNNDLDCDDADQNVNPGEPEIWYDAIDQNCDGLNDFDKDFDGYVDSNFPGEEGGSAPFGGDCDDSNPDIHPGATEIVDDGIDQDCNGYDAVHCYVDDDFDNYGDGSVAQIISYDGDCDDLGESENDLDCDDNNPSVNPGEAEIVNDGIDQDCNGFDAVYCYVDDDFDNYGDGAAPQIISYDGDCDDLGESENDLDCDDNLPDVNPDAAEIWYDGIDQNCDNLNDFDQDFDGYVDENFPGEEGGSAPMGGDCDDSNPDVNPAEVEIAADGIDNDCDGTCLCFLDADNDGFRPDGTATVESIDCDCDDFGEATATDPIGDCDDSNPDINPAEVEIAADGIDNDCDGTCLCFLDADDDGFRPDGTATVESIDCDCDDFGEATATDPIGDCDDSNPNIHPGAIDIADDGIDNDCDGTCLCFLDADDDGYRPDGTATVESADCDCDDFGEATATDPIGDCDDSNPDIHPGAIDIADDGIDNDCDGTCLCFLDADDDGFRPNGTATVESTDCDCDDFGEATATDPIGDCDDSNPDINPDAVEIWYDGIDQNCDNLNDFDQDFDGYIDENFLGEEGGSAPMGGDCDDSNPDINPNATEICDGIDNNCIDGIDEDFYANMYYDNATVCYNNENYIPTIEGVLGGTFTSSPDGLIIDIITGEINVENSDLGDYIIAYQTESPCDIQSNFNLSIVTTNISVTENHPNLTANNDIANYQWIDCSDISIIEGETNQLFTALEDGSYAVIITEDVCVDTSQCYEIIGLGYNSFKNEIKIYPNPTNGEITISLAKEQDVKIIVTNITGQTVKLDSYKNTKLLNVNIVGTSGIYFVEIISNTETVVFKLIKQ